MQETPLWFLSREDPLEIHSSILGLKRYPGEGICYPLQCSWASLVAQLVKNPPAMWETWVQSLGWDDLLKGKATHSSILAWWIPWTEQPIAHEVEIVRHDWASEVKWLSRVRLFATPWTVAYQAPPSVYGIFQQENWSGLPFPSPWLSKHTCYWLWTNQERSLKLRLWRKRELRDGIWCWDLKVYSSGGTDEMMEGVINTDLSGLLHCLLDKENEQENLPVCSYGESIT